MAIDPRDNTVQGPRLRLVRPADTAASSRAAGVRDVVSLTKPTPVQRAASRPADRVTLSPAAAPTATPTAPASQIEHKAPAGVQPESTTKTRVESSLVAARVDVPVDPALAEPTASRAAADQATPASARRALQAYTAGGPASLTIAGFDTYA